MNRYVPARLRAGSSWFGARSLGPRTPRTASSESGLPPSGSDTVSTGTHGYCTACRARVTVQGQSCLLGHPVDPATLSRSPGRHTATRRPSTPPATERIVSVSALRPPASGPAPDLEAPAPTAPPSAVSRWASEADSGSLAPTATLVAALWDATAPIDVLDGWDVGADPLEHVAGGDRRRRRTRTTLVVVSAVVMVLGSWYLAGLRGRQAHAETEQIAVSAGHLAVALDGAQPLVTDLADGELADPASAAVATSRLADASRALFAAAESARSPRVAEARLDATRAAGQATTLGSDLTEAAAYDGIVALAFEPPALRVVVPPEDVPSVASEVAWWVTSLGALAKTLPDGEPIRQHRTDVAAFVEWLAGWQVAYLDGLTGDDVAAATTERNALLTRVDTLIRDWQETLAAIGSEASEELVALADVARALSQPD